VSSITWKSAAWVSGAALAVGGCAAGIVIAAQIGGRADAGHAVKTAAVGPAAAQPLRVVSVSPSGGARDVNGAGRITVTYNQPLPAAAALPVLSPAVAVTVTCVPGA
jgi:hypothetical protein